MVVHSRGRPEEERRLPKLRDKARFTLGESELTKAAREHCNDLLTLFDKGEDSLTSDGRKGELMAKAGPILTNLEKLHSSGRLLSPGANVEGEKIRGLTDVRFAIKKNPFGGYNLIIEGE